MHSASEKIYSFAHYPTDDRPTNPPTTHKNRHSVWYFKNSRKFKNTNVSAGVCVEIMLEIIALQVNRQSAKRKRKQFV